MVKRKFTHRQEYIPNKGDAVWINFNPTKGREQSGERPAIVISDKKYNEKSGLSLLCPITSQAKGYPFEVAVETGNVKGVVLVDQIKSIDWRERKAKFAAKATKETMLEIKQKLFAIIN